MNPETVRKHIRKAGYNGRVARKKPYISEQNRKRRLEFAREHIKYDADWWRNVIFADESKFNIFGSDGRRHVWRKPNEELNPRNLKPTVKHGGGNVMMWGCFSSAGMGEMEFIDNIMDHMGYLRILKNHLHSSAEKLGIRNTFHFYQDNDPKHKAYNVRGWLLQKCPKVISTPAQTPDLNPIENLWQELDDRVRKKPVTLTDELKRRLREEWNGIDPAYTNKLVASMPKRLQAVIKQNGHITKY